MINSVFCRMWPARHHKNVPCCLWAEKVAYPWSRNNVHGQGVKYRNLNQRLSLDFHHCPMLFHAVPFFMQTCRLVSGCIMGQRSLDFTPPWAVSNQLLPRLTTVNIRMQWFIVQHYTIIGLNITASHP